MVTRSPGRRSPGHDSDEITVQERQSDDQDEPDVTHRLSPAPEVQAAADAWIATLSADHGSELFIGEIVVPLGESITRWFIGLAHAPLPDGGRPALTLQFEDVGNDTYEKIILGRPRRIFRSLQNRDSTPIGRSPAARHASLARLSRRCRAFHNYRDRTLLRPGPATCRTTASPSIRDRLI